MDGNNLLVFGVSWNVRGFNAQIDIDWRSFVSYGFAVMCSLDYSQLGFTGVN